MAACRLYGLSVGSSGETGRWRLRCERGLCADPGESACQRHGIMCDTV